jgi:phage-related protein
MHYAMLRWGTAKVLKGFSGADVVEILADGQDGTYRAVYTVRFLKAVFILHVFQKKSKSGIATPKKEIDLIKSRLRIAESIYNEKYLNQK